MSYADWLFQALKDKDAMPKKCHNCGSTDFGAKFAALPMEEAAWGDPKQFSPKQVGIVVCNECKYMMSFDLGGLHIDFDDYQ